MTNVGFAKAIEHIFFIHSQENADVEWKFTRTQMWLEWIDRINNVPVPFNLLYFILRCLFPECFKKCCCEGRQTDVEQGNGDGVADVEQGNGDSVADCPSSDTWRKDIFRCP